MNAPAIKIPLLASWTKEGSKHTLFRAGIGYLHIKPVAGVFQLTVRPDLDGVEVGPAQVLCNASTREKLVERAQQLYTTQYDEPVTTPTVSFAELQAAYKSTQSRTAQDMLLMQMHNHPDHPRNK